MERPIFTEWTHAQTQLWGHVPLLLRHRLHEHKLFSREALASLIENYPPEHYMLVHMGAQGERRLWREGKCGDLSGAQVIDAIAKGRMWLNLIRVNEVDPRYGDLLDDLFEEIGQHVPGDATFKRINGILISSPLAQVYYHFDTSGQSLWQIEGAKRVYLYPAVPPFLTEQALEDVCLYHNETGISYEPWFDEHATVYELGPGEMMHWPLNMPHRIENLDNLSISMTCEYSTAAIQRRMVLNSANGILRHSLHLKPERNLSGLSYWAKLALYGAVKKSGMLEQKRRERRPVTFRLDPARVGDIINV